MSTFAIFEVLNIIFGSKKQILSLKLEVEVIT
jgi:hypothetical protein